LSVWFAPWTLFVPNCLRKRAGATGVFYSGYTIKDYLTLGKGSIFAASGKLAPFREKQKARNRKWAERTGRVKPASKRAPKLTPEEKRERARQRSREYYASHREQCLAAKHKWYQENHEYALQYQKAYAKGVRTGEKGPSKKVR
jgi:hypothetical protein